METGAAGAALETLLASHQIVPLEPGALGPQADLLVMAYPDWTSELARALGEVQAYHKGIPLKRGMPREQLRARLKLAPRVFNALARRMVSEGQLEESAALVWLPGFRVRLNPQQQAQVDALLARFAASPFAPPSVKECQAALGEDLYAVLADGSVLVQVSPEVVFRKGDYDAMVEAVRGHLRQHGTLTVAEFRDLFKTSRKYALGLLEYLDASGVTVREGDNRRLAQ
jgi:selenocysteine-specific elongation factor